MITYVLVHGSWHGAWCWYKITARLRSQGHTVIMPGHGRYWLTFRPGKLQAAATFGGSGRFERTRTSEFRRTRPDGVEQVFPARTYTSGLPPIAPTVGVAFKYTLTPRVALRADAQAVLCPYFDAIGGMASAGVSIPIGRRAP